MKLLFGNGRVLEVRDCGPVVYRLIASAVPIKLNGYRVTSDSEARDLLLDLRSTGLYESEALP